jgi:peptidoglycan hydrolase-like protein with peptidoglycan-binding domain
MTQAAVKNFQQAKNIQATGRLDEQTLNALDIEGPG